MGNDYGVLVATGDGSDKIFSVLPESQVFAVTFISIDSEVTFSRVSIYKDDLYKIDFQQVGPGSKKENKYRNILVESRICRTINIIVIQPPRQTGLVLLCTGLNGFQRRD